MPFLFDYQWKSRTLLFQEHTRSRIEYLFWLWVVPGYSAVLNSTPRYPLVPKCLVTEWLLSWWNSSTFWLLCLRLCSLQLKIKCSLLFGYVSIKFGLYIFDSWLQWWYFSSMQYRWFWFGLFWVLVRTGACSSCWWCPSRRLAHTSSNLLSSTEAFHTKSILHPPIALP